MIPARFVLTAALLAAVVAPAPAQAPDPALVAKATAGDPAAQLAAADALAKSASAQPDPDDRAATLAQAATWVRKAAEQSHLPAELRLAECYRDGRGLPRDPAQAAVWYRRAADQGEVTAQATLGTLYSMGRGVPQDYAEAYFWFDVAALAPSPNQTRYAALRQQMGAQITADELTEEHRRLKKWKAAHASPEQP